MFLQASLGALRFGQLPLPGGPLHRCGHGCAYCYVLAQAETDWTQGILIHGDIVGQLGEELQAIPPQTIYMGYHTDPYQPCEADHRQTRGLFEAYTAETEKRIDASRRFKQAAVRAGALVCPVVPYITDAVRLIDRLQSCADTIWVYGLSITDRQGPNWRYTQQLLRRHFPDMSARIEAAHISQGHPFWQALRSRLEALKADCQVNLKVHV